MKLKICCLILIVFLLSSCKAEDKTFSIPVNYTADAVVKVFAPTREDIYNLNIICRDNNYSIKLSAGNQTWNTAYLSGGRCVLSNDKFPDSSVTIENFKTEKYLVQDIDLTKFQNTEDGLSEEIIYWDGTFRHVLSFNSENLLPDTIFIYKNDDLVKTIKYENIKIEE
ncbi:MAG: hypothetical protein K0Q47_1547 [Sedimentibacter sp.]|jgi:hypothetical protein|nr:hypothetical protein [Sedimentibacter sp.]